MPTSRRFDSRLVSRRDSRASSRSSPTRRSISSPNRCSCPSSPPRRPRSRVITSTCTVRFRISRATTRFDVTAPRSPARRVRRRRGDAAPILAVDFLVSAAPRRDLTVRELPHFAIARVAFRWFAAVTATARGESDLTRVRPRGASRRPVRSHRRVREEHARRRRRRARAQSFTRVRVSVLGQFRVPTRAWPRRSNERIPTGARTPRRRSSRFSDTSRRANQNPPKGASSTPTRKSRT